MIHPSTAPLLNVKLKLVSKVYYVLYNDSAGGKLYPNANVQKNSLEHYACSYIMFVQLRIIESIATACAFLYNFMHKDVFEPAYLSGYSIKVTL